MKRNWWLFASAGGLLLSIVTLFLPVIRYTAPGGALYSFNIVGCIRDAELLIDAVFNDYTGSFLVGSTMQAATGRVIAVAVIGAVAIILAAVGIATLSKQRRNVWPFVLALLGLVGTAVPATILLVLLLLSGSSFLGAIHIGAYEIVTPLAMILALLAVTWKRKATLAELQAQEEARKYLYDPGRL